MEKSRTRTRDVPQDPDVKFETDLQADPSLREGPMSRGRLLFLVAATIFVVVMVLWVIIGTR